MKLLEQKEPAASDVRMSSFVERFEVFYRRFLKTLNHPECNGGYSIVGEREG